MQNILCTIEARMNSSRLPGKVLKKINNTTVLEILFKRIKRCKKINNIVLSTTRQKIDDRIIKICKNNRINYYRGSESNVLERLVQTGKYYKADIIVQLTGDNIFVDPEMIDYMVRFFLKNNKIDYLTNNGLGKFEMRNVPIGLDVQIYYFKHLEKIYKIAKKKDLKEHPSLYFYREGKDQFNLHNIKLPKKFVIDKNYRLTLDEIEDYKVLKKIYLYFKNKKELNFSVKDLSFYLSNNPKLLSINEKITQKKINL